MDSIASTLTGVWPQVQNRYMLQKTRHDGCFHVYDKTLIIFNDLKKETSPQLPSLVGEVLGEVLEVILCCYLYIYSYQICVAVVNYDFEIARHFDIYFYIYIYIYFKIKQLQIQILVMSIHKDIFACLFSIHNTISVSCHEKVCLNGLRFESVMHQQNSLI